MTLNEPISEDRSGVFIINARSFNSARLPAPAACALRVVVVREGERVEDAIPESFLNEQNELSSVSVLAPEVGQHNENGEDDVQSWVGAYVQQCRSEDAVVILARQKRQEEDALRHEEEALRQLREPPESTRRGSVFCFMALCSLALICPAVFDSMSAFWWALVCVGLISSACSCIECFYMLYLCFVDCGDIGPPSDLGLHALICFGMAYCFAGLPIKVAWVVVAAILLSLLSSSAPVFVALAVVHVVLASCTFVHHFVALGLWTCKFCLECGDELPYKLVKNCALCLSCALPYYYCKYVRHHRPSHNATPTVAIPECAKSRVMKFVRNHLQLNESWLPSNCVCCYCVSCLADRNKTCPVTLNHAGKQYSFPRFWTRFGLGAGSGAQSARDELRHRCYHGTSAHAAQAIVKSGVLLFPGDRLPDRSVLQVVPGHIQDPKHATRAFFSPSLAYAQCPAYCRVEKFRNRLFVVALEVSVEPGSYDVGSETIMSSLELQRDLAIDASFPNDTLEWSTDCREE